MRAFALGFLMLAAAPGLALAETFPVITDKAVIKECGECHMAFPPETLPKAAWENIFASLSKHFGEDASLKPEVIGHLRDFHLANASDVSKTRAAEKWRVDGAAPVRIVDAPRFIKKHQGCDAAWSHEKIRSKANCLACHPGMAASGNADAKMNFLQAGIRGKCGEEDN